MGTMRVVGGKGGPKVRRPIGTEEEIREEAAERTLADELRDRFRAARSTEERLARDVPPRRWLVDRLIPAEVGMFVIGEGGCGKGHLLFHLAVRLACGWDFAGFAVERPQKVLMLSREDDDDEIDRRLQAAVRLSDDALGAGTEWRKNLGRNLHLRDIRGVQGVSIGSPHLMEAVIDESSRVGGADLIILDPLGRLLDEHLDLNSQAGAGRIHVAVDELVNRTRATIAIVHHVSKAGRSTAPGEDRGAGASSGSHLLEDLARSVLRVVPLGDDAKARYGLDKNQSLVEVSMPKANYSTALDGPIVFRRCAGGALLPITTRPVADVLDDRVFEALPADGATWKEWEAACRELVPPIGTNAARRSRARLTDARRVIVEEMPGDIRKKRFFPAPTGQDA